MHYIFHTKLNNCTTAYTKALTSATRMETLFHGHWLGAYYNSIQDWVMKETVKLSFFTLRRKTRQTSPLLVFCVYLLVIRVMFKNLLSALESIAHILYFSSYDVQRIFILCLEKQLKFIKTWIWNKQDLLYSCIVFRYPSARNWMIQI